MKITMRFTAEEIRKFVESEARESIALGPKAKVQRITFVVGLPDGDFVGADVEIDEPR